MCRFTSFCVLALLAALSNSSCQAAIAPTASTTSSRSTSTTNNMGQVVAGMTAQGCEELTTACLLTSRSVTTVERQYVTGQLVGAAASSSSSAQDSSVASSTTSAMGNAERALVLAQPLTTTEIVQATVAAGGNVIYCPSRIDLARGEGLMDSLGPAMQVILDQKLQASLWVVADDPDAAQRQLQASIEAVLPRLIGTKALATLQDVFASVRYVTPAQALETLTTERNAATEVASRVAIASKTSGRSSAAASAAATTLSPADLATARTLGPVLRSVTANAVAVVHAQCRDDGDLPVRVADFGQLAQAALQAAQQEIASLFVPQKSALAKQMQAAAVAQMEFTLQADFDQQLQLLSEESFQAFRKSLSKLIIGPNLAADMTAAAQQHVATFGKQARRLVASSTTWSTSAAVAALQTRLRDTVTARLATARASGKFRPLPRKGVTIGLHWLLPKPFGNDYRQEPWLVHASDNLVYVPADKVTEVSPEAVAAGEDWRNQIVPSPVGNDMIFMQ